MKRLLALVAALLTLTPALPAAAALNPTVTLYTSGTYGAPGSYRVVTGYITLGASDTYATGGFTLTPAQLGLQLISGISFAESSGAFSAISTVSAGVSTVKFYSRNPTSTSSTPTITSTSSTPTITSTSSTPTITSTSSTPTITSTSSTPTITSTSSTPTITPTFVSGASQILATATTATVTGLSGLTINTPIMCQLNDAATGGGGTGTWSTTAAVASCKYASASSFTITSTAAAPTNGGNFTYSIPTLTTMVSSTPTITSTSSTPTITSTSSTPTITSTSSTPTITSTSSTPTITSTSSTPTITNAAAYAELANTTSVNSVVIPFTAFGQ